MLALGICMMCCSQVRYDLLNSPSEWKQDMLFPYIVYKERKKMRGIKTLCTFHSYYFLTMPFIKCLEVFLGKQLV